MCLNSDSGNPCLGTELISAAWVPAKMLMSQVKERLSLSCASGRAKREVAFEFDLNTLEGFGEEVGKRLHFWQEDQHRQRHGGAGCIEAGK